jgi:hypothetical protein
MKTREDNVWKSLLTQSAPAFAADVELPFGLATRVLAGVRHQHRQEAAWERTGLRAIFASLAAVVGLALFTFVVERHRSNEIDPGIPSLAVVENLPVS